MAKPFCPLFLLLTMASVFFLVHSSNQLELSDAQTLRRIIQLFNDPLSPRTMSLSNSTAEEDLCSVEPTQSLTIVCFEGDITQLHIIGDGGDGGDQRREYSLPRSFSTHALFASMARLPSLKVLTLANLGLRGPLPGNIGRLGSLEIFNASSNLLSGEIPVQLLHLRNLHTLILDHNRFSGKIPFWVRALPTLTVLSLRDNELSGLLPNSIAKLRNLRSLVLAGNNLSGQVPDLTKLTNLQTLDLKDNDFGPHFPGLPRKLVSLGLGNNSFRYNVPESLGSFYFLQTLDISSNRFVGPFSSSLLSLPSINYLDVSGNMLTGALSNDVSCSPSLHFVNLSSNYLQGKLPSCLRLLRSNKASVVEYSGNCLSNDHHDGDDDQKNPQHPPDFCHKEALAVEVLPHREKHSVSQTSSRPVVASGVVGGIVGCVLLVGLVSFFVKKVYYGKDKLRRQTSTRFITENVSDAHTAKMLSSAKYIPETMKMGASLPAFRTFSLEELKEATNNFDSSTIMGQSSNGQMFKGTLSDGTLVAIRSLKMRKKRAPQPQAYTHQLELISKLRHFHLVSALGHCLEYQPDDACVSTIFLVFEFVQNGTLRDFISARQGQKLNWTQRISAAIGVAKGIQFLHTGIVPGLYSNDLKITNVLMDQNLQVKLSSYNLPLLAENGSVVHSSSVKGSSQERIVTDHEDKTDIYDIGVILLEIILGRPILFHNEVGSLKDLLRVSVTTEDAGSRTSIVDPNVHNQCFDKSLRTIMEICVRCLSTEPRDRPSIEDILWTLQFAAQVQDSGSMNSIESMPTTS